MVTGRQIWTNLAGLDAREAGLNLLFSITVIAVAPVMLAEPEEPPPS